MSRRPGWGDRGSSAVFFAVLLLPLLLLAGVVIDGGRAIVQRQRAGDIALEAARLAANQCDPTAFYANKGCEVSDVAGARAAILTFVASQSKVGDQRVDLVKATPMYPQADGNAGGFSVTVRVTEKTALLDIVHIDQINVTSTESARSITREG